MGKSITGALQMSDQKILKGSHSVTSSPESVDGREHYSSQDGVQTDLFGLEALPASHSLQPGKEKEKTTSDISGRSSLISSASASLQQSLVSKLQQLSDSDGSMIYKLTLREKVTPAQRSYYQLAASAPRTKERDSSSWLTPTTSDTNGVRKPDGKRGLGLNTQAQSAWPTPRVADTNNLNNSPTVVQARVTKGRATVAEIASHNVSSWPTPAARDVAGKSGAGRQKRKGNPSDTVPNGSKSGGRNSSVGNTDSDRPKSRNEAAETAGHGNPINSASIWPDSVGNTEHDGSHEAEIGRSTGPGKAEGGMLELERSDSLFWGSSEVIYCRDGKYRPIPTEPEIFPLADGIPNRVGILRGAGNAIVPQAAAEIIKAYLYD
jgi:hypothetical protein